MPKIEDVFRLYTARASSFSHYSKGDVAYVTNGFTSNGILGFVTPRLSDGVYKFVGLALSAFCEATVQLPPFIARGNGGSGLMVLEPKTRMTVGTLAYLAGYINTSVRWRFNWYHQATVDRVRRLTIPDPSDAQVDFPVKELLPRRTRPVTVPSTKVAFKSFLLAELFQLEAGAYHNGSELPKGIIPLISCGDS